MRSCRYKKCGIVTMSGGQRIGSSNGGIQFIIGIKLYSYWYDPNSDQRIEVFETLAAV